MEDQEDRTPRRDGSDPVEEHPSDTPGAGRTATQYIIIGLGALILIAALLWVVLPFSAG